MKTSSTEKIALYLKRKEAAACQAFVRASEQAEARIVAALEAVRPFREELEQVKMERVAFAAGPVGSASQTAVPDPEREQLIANLSLSAFASALNAQSFVAPEKPQTGAKLRALST